MYHVEAVYSMSYNIHGIREHDNGKTNYCCPIIVIFVYVFFFTYSALHCVSSLLDICWFGQNTVHIIMSSDSECPNYH